MPYSIAGMECSQVLVVVVAELTEPAEWSYERGKFGATSSELQRLADWFQQRDVQEVVIESTAQYWRPVWGAREQYWTPVMRRREGAGPMAGKLPLAQAQSHRGPRGRNNDDRDAERFVHRLVAQELVLSFVADPQQTAVAHAPAPQAAVSQGPHAVSEPAGGAAGTDAPQVVVL